MLLEKRDNLLAGDSRVRHLVNEDDGTQRVREPCRVLQEVRVHVVPRGNGALHETSLDLSRRHTDLAVPLDEVLVLPRCAGQQ